MKAKIENNYITIISTLITIFVGISALFFAKESFLLIKQNIVVFLFISIIIFQIFILNVKVDSVKRKELKGLKLLQELTCYNQTSFLDFNTISSELHKKIKAEIIRDNINNEKLNETFKEFNDFISSNIDKILKHNINFLEKYYSHQKSGKTLPRISVRILKGEQLISIEDEDNKNRFTESIKALKTDTGLKFATTHGTYYLCNDIPQASVMGEYYNQSLIREKAIKFKPSFFTLFFKKKYDEKWCQCWKDEYCYKSTLIIPMTLMNNNMSDEFRKHFAIKDVGRSIWGYICLDHPETNYFEESMDVSIGYIFADIISLYLVTIFLFTEGSQSYHKAKNYLNVYDENNLGIISLDLFSPTSKFSGRKKPRR